MTDPVVQAMARDLRTHVAISDELAVYVVEMLILAARQVRPDVMPGVVTVSYTHLTLPTKRIV